MYNVVFAKVGGSPKQLILNRSEVIDLFLDNPYAFISINGMQINLNAIKHDKQLNRQLKLKILKRKAS